MTADVLVIGGGPAGAASAAALAAGGRRVTLVEREATPGEKVCGEFLGPDASACLARLGLDPAALGGVPITAARLGAERGEAGFALPFTGWGLSRRVLDAALLGRAAAAGATLRMGATVRAAEHRADGWHVRLDDGVTLRAPAVVLATGKHALRGHPRATAAPGMLGVKLHLALAVPLAEVVLLPLPGGYAGLQPAPGDPGHANLCCALPTALAPLTRDGGALLARVAAGSRLAARLLAGAVPLWPRPLAIAAVPYGFLHRDAAEPPPDLYRVGDQFAVIPSLTGDGVAMALAGGLRAAGALLSGIPAAGFHAEWRAALATPMRTAGLLATLLARAPGTLVAATHLAPALARLAARRTRVPGLGG